MVTQSDLAGAMKDKVGGFISIVVMGSGGIGQTVGHTIERFNDEGYLGG